MTYLSLSDEQSYREYFVRNFVKDHTGKFKSFPFDGSVIQFYENTFYHAFFDSDKNGKRTKFSPRRANRMGVIKDFLDGTCEYVTYIDNQTHNKILCIKESDCIISVRYHKDKYIFVTLFTMSPAQVEARVASGRWMLKK